MSPAPTNLGAVPARRRRHVPGAATVVAALALVLAAGCASVPEIPTAAQLERGFVDRGADRPTRDPWERWNRKVYAFNDAVDTAVIKPVAQAYKALVPSPVRTGVSNVLGNIGDVWSTANHLLQGKVQTGLEMGMRVVTNTLFGLGGLLDPATEMGLIRRYEDFGQTLGTWGVSTGPYLVLPLLGPSTVRDAAALLVDRQAAASRLPPTDAGRWGVTALELVDTRALLLGTTDLIDGAALDRYTFVRDGFLSRRRDLQFDGVPPGGVATDPGDSPPAAGPAPTPAAGAAPRPPAPASAPR